MELTAPSHRLTNGAVTRPLPSRQSDPNDSNAGTNRTALSGEDRAVVERIRAGDARTFDALYLGHFRALLGVAYHLVGSTAEAEEIVQDVFAEVWRRRGMWAPVAGVSAYLFRAVRNRALDVRARTRVAHDVRTAARAAGESLAAADGAIAADDALMARELDTALARAVAALPERRRLALTLRVCHGMSYAQIATVLGVSAAAAMVLVARARSSLGGLRAQYGGESPTA